MTPPPGLVGRFVSYKIRRGDTYKEESCEVVACQTGGGGWKILIATHDGLLFDVAYGHVRIVPFAPGTGPYR